jgi:recombination associated protein RdgC
MLFRNLTLFRFPSSLRLALEAIDQHLPEAALKPVGPLQLSSRGFVSPFGRGDDSLSHRVGNCILFTLGGEDKILPSAVVNEALAAKLDALREREGRNPGGRERKRLKDEVLTDLLPRAFVRPSRSNAYFDLDRGWLVVDTSSRKVAEQFVTAIREALGSFPALPVNAESSPRALLTAWVSGETIPKGFELGDEVELRDPVDSGAIVKCRRQDLDSDEITEHLKAGKQGFQLALTFDERLSFVIGEDIVVRKLKFLETATEALERDERDSLRAEIDATFALMSLELRRLLDRLEAEFSLSKADA